MKEKPKLEPLKTNNTETYTSTCMMAALANFSTILGMQDRIMAIRLSSPSSEVNIKKLFFSQSAETSPVASTIEASSRWKTVFIKFNNNKFIPK